MAENRTYRARCYVEHIRDLQDTINSCVKRYPHLTDVVPRFEYHTNYIGPGWVDGEPVHDPFISILWSN